MLVMHPAQLQQRRLAASYATFTPCGASLCAAVVRQVETLYPDVRTLMPEDPAILNQRLFTTLGQIVEHWDEFPILERPLMELGAKAARCGFSRPAHYARLRECLMNTMGQLAGREWTPQIQRDWTDLFDATAGAMLRGAYEAERRAA